MIYPPDFLSKLTTLGTLGYNIQKIINILNIPEAEHEGFIADFNNPKSEVRTAFQRGVDQSDFAIDQKLFTLAQTGDLKAIELYDEHKNRNMSTFDAQEFELKATMINNEKLKLARERNVDAMIKKFLGYDSE